MTVRRIPVLCTAAVAASISASHAGPCSHEIDRLRNEIDTRLVALADSPLQKLEAITAAMTRARAADDAGDRSVCEKALADARRALGQ
jgi:hypothetical protein